MDVMSKTFEVKHGSIYDDSGYMIDNMSVIFNKNFGLYKYGEKSLLKKYYDKLIYSMLNTPSEHMIEDYVLIELDRYSGILNIEEICVISNYLTMSSGNVENQLKLFTMSASELKEKIAILSEWGY